MDSRLFKGIKGVGVKSVQTFYSLPRWYFLRGRTPAYPLFRKEKIHPHRRRSSSDAERFERVLRILSPLRRRKYPIRRRELFSLRKKRTAGIRPSAWQKAGSLYRLNPTPFPPLKKPFKNYGFQGDLIPLAGARGQSPRGLPLPLTSLGWGPSWRRRRTSRRS